MNLKMIRAFVIALASMGLVTDVVTFAHEWTDASGNYKLEAELLVRNDHTIVLQQEDNSLLMVEIDQLSEADKRYLVELKKKQDEAHAKSKASGNQLDHQSHTWNLVNGMAINGKVSEHGRKLVEIRRHSSKIYVNDRRFKNLPKFYQQMIPAIVNHFESTEISDEKQLTQWLARQKGHSRSYTVEGVLMESYDGDLHGVPFFLFNEEDLAILKPGWEEWLSADEDAKHKAELALRLQAESIAKQRNQGSTQRLQRLNVQLAAFNSGLFDLWKVTMHPPGNQYGVGVQVVVPARSSDNATDAAREIYPEYRVGSIVKVRRRR